MKKVVIVPAGALSAAFERAFRPEFVGFEQVETPPAQGGEVFLGIALKTTRWLCAELPRHLPNSRAVAAWCGLTPRLRQSGSSLHGTRSIGREGHRFLRKVLSLPAVVARSRNPRLKAFADSPQSRGQSTMSVLIAVEHKPLRHAFALLKNRSTDDPNHHPLKPSSTSYFPLRHKTVSPCFVSSGIKAPRLPEKHPGRSGQTHHPRQLTAHRRDSADAPPETPGRLPPSPPSTASGPPWSPRQCAESSDNSSRPTADAPQAAAPS